MAYDVHIERGKIREFAKATKSTSPDHDGPDAVIPPTFLTTAQNFWVDAASARPVADLGFNLARVLHGEEEFEFFGPPPVAGDVLAAETAIGEQWEKEGKRGGTMRFAKVVTQFRDAEGALRAEQRTTIIETGKAPTAVEA